MKAIHSISVWVCPRKGLSQPCEHPTLTLTRAMPAIMILDGILLVPHFTKAICRWSQSWESNNSGFTEGLCFLPKRKAITVTWFGSNLTAYSMGADYPKSLGKMKKNRQGLSYRSSSHSEGTSASRLWDRSCMKHVTIDQIEGSITRLCQSCHCCFGEGNASKDFLPLVSPTCIFHL